MGGPVASGPYTCEVVHFGQYGQVFSLSPAATPQGGNAELCDDLPQLDQ